MKDPQRLLEGGGSAQELLLLRAGETEEPSDLGKQKLAAALGIALGVTATAGAATASQAGAGAGAATSIAPGAKIATPWLLSLLGGAVLGGAALTYVAMRPAEQAPVAVVQPAPKAQVRASEPEPEATPQALPEAPKPSEIEEPAEPAARSVASSDPKSIAREIAALDDVRRALSAGEPQKALKQLGDYGRSHPRGVLRQEATLLRIEALARVGDRAAARRLADRFLSANPASPHEKRIRALVGDSP